LTAALFAFVLLTQANPDEARFQAARQMRETGRCGEAIPALQELARKYPGSASIAFLLGECLFDMKEYTGAVAAFAQAVIAQPKSAAARYFLGSALGLSGKMPESIEQLRKATELDPQFAPAYRVLGMYRVESGQLVAETRAALERAVALDPTDRRAHYWLGKYFLAVRDYGAARRELAIAVQPGAVPTEARLAYGDALNGTGDVDGAVEQFSAVLKEDPASARALLGRARGAYKQQRFDAALKDALAAERPDLDPDQQRTRWWILSRIYRALNREGDAESAEREMTVLERETDLRMARFRTLQETASRLRAAGETAKVIGILEEALKIEQRQDSLVMLGDCYFESGRYADAELAYLRASQAGEAGTEIADRLEKARARRAGRD
jgi:tetratricopeptide (TPR) repeat protein